MIGHAVEHPPHLAEERIEIREQIEHIGIAGDFDGISFTIEGLEDTSKYPALLTELARRGWTERELRLVTGENFLRVFETVERRSAELRRGN